MKMFLNTCVGAKNGSLGQGAFCWYMYIYLVVVVGFSLTFLSRLFHSYRDEPIDRWGETGVPRENHLSDTPASRTWLVSHVASAELEPTPDTAMR